jgi:hydroxyethylthiazole kinase-like uncharacterized protein yjeF
VVRAAYDADDIRRAEEPLLAALPSGTLMQRASTALARRSASLLQRVYGARVVLLVGAGNNGADALYAGAMLVRRGAQVEAVLTTDRVHEAGLAAFRTGGGRVVPADGSADPVVRRADLVIDGMLGIGGRGGLRGRQAALAELLDALDAIVVAVDVPSGVDASTGVVDGTAVRADVTVTFGALKVGLVVAPGAAFAGFVEVVDIGLDLPDPRLTVLDADDVAAMLPTLSGETDKYRRGVVGVVAGSDGYTGAAVLVVAGALTAGAGMVRYVGPPAAAEVVRQRWPEAVVSIAGSGDAEAVAAAGRVQAWVVGPGLGTDAAAEDTVRAVLGTDLPVVADADAVTLIARDKALVAGRAAPTLLTPHAGEFARLVGADRADVEARRLEHVVPAAAELSAAVLLKGSTTLVADPGGHVRSNTTDTPYLATAGSGDVLSGICGALVATGLDVSAAAAAGTFLHGLAGIIAVGDPPAPVTAMQIAESVPAAIRRVRSC